MIQFYKPNSKVTGTACSFWLNKDGTIMSSMIKQDSWNDARKIGSFSKNKDNPNARVIVKLGRVEVAGIIDALEREAEFKVYHKSQNQVLQIRFGLYLDKVSGEKKGFSFSVNKQGVDDSTAKASFVIGFTYPEARLLRHDLSMLLSQTQGQQVKEDSSPREGGLNAEPSPAPAQAPAQAPARRFDTPKPTSQNNAPAEEELW